MPSLTKQTEHLQVVWLQTGGPVSLLHTGTDRVLDGATRRFHMSEQKG